MQKILLIVQKYAWSLKEVYICRSDRCIAQSNNLACHFSKIDHSGQIRTSHNLPRYNVCICAASLDQASLPCRQCQADIRSMGVVKSTLRPLITTRKF